MEKSAASRHSGKGRSNAEGDGITRLIEQNISSTYDDMIAIIEAKTELIKIDLTEKIAVVASLLILLLILLAGTAYLLSTVAVFLGELTGHPFVGYLAVSIFFFAMFALFTKVRPDFLKNFIHKIILSANDYRK